MYRMRKENRKYVLNKVPCGYGYSYQISGRHIKDIILSAGLEDRIVILRTGETSYCLSINSRHGYIGLQVLVENGQNVFFQNAIEEFGERIFDYSDIYIAKALLEYMD